MGEPPQLERLRALCTALPEVTERLSHGSPAWFARRQFAAYVDDHHGDGILGVWAAAPPGAQAELVAHDPERYYRPAYVGGRGWVGMRLDTGEVDWDEVAEVVTDAWRCVAPPRLVTAWEASRGGAPT